MATLHKSATVVDIEGLTIEELVGNVGTKQDNLSVAHVTYSKPSEEPWLTIDYDEWLCVRKGKVEVKFSEDVVKSVGEGEVLHIPMGQRFKPSFPFAGTEYLAICSPAFIPERCHREEDGKGAPPSKKDESDIIYHMCPEKLWNEAVAAGEAYFPATFDVDGFTHATAVPARLLKTANHFYTESKGDWVCISMSINALKRKHGIVTKFEEPMNVGAQETAKEFDEWKCPHVFGGIPTVAGSVVQRIYKMERKGDGSFVGIHGLL